MTLLLWATNHDSTCLPALTAHTIAWLEREWKEEVLDNLHRNDEKRRSSIRWTLELLQRQRWGNFWETWWSTYGLFWVHIYILNWTELTALMRADPVSMEARRVSPILMPITCAPGAMPLRSGWSGKFPAEMQATWVPWAPEEDSHSTIIKKIMFLVNWITLS